MSTEVENRVVEMQFRNDRFEKNVATTLSTLDKLKQKLNFSGVSKGFEDISDAAGKVNMSSLGRGVESVTSQFSALQVIGVTALANIANSAVNAGKRMISALTIDPIKTGFSEYETQINAIQTILANTESKGTTLENVNSALDTLNTYADKTIYNFTEMTRNIGTFTAAGIGLETSVNAIQGIANLAAVSGSTSQQASTAMYQLSQALASGTVKLMDWNSVVNAGMGGQVFQDALKETARVHGIGIDKMIEDEGSFRETLQNGWLTADILTETLEKFTMATDGLSEAEIEVNRQRLKSIGYTDEQIEGIFKLGNTATNAATKVKTFTQLWDTLKESAQSGWTQTWEIIVGDFEESKAMLTKVSDVIGGLLSDSAKVRNDLLQGWKDAGGRADLIDAVSSAFDALMGTVGAIKSAFTDIFPPLTVEQLKNFTEGLKKLAESMKPSAATLENIKNTFKGVFAVVDIARQALVSAFKVIQPLFGGLVDLSGGLLGVTGSLGSWVVGLNESIKKTGFFERAVEGIRSVLTPVADWIKEFGRALGSAFDGVSDATENRLKPLAAIGNLLKGIFAGIGNVLKTIAPFVATAATKIGEVLSDLMKTITASVQNADFDSFFGLASGGIMTAIGVFVAKFFKAGSGILDGTNGFLENINGILEGVSDALGAFTSAIKAEALKKIATAIAILAGSLFVMSLIDSEKLTLSLVAVTAMFSELMGAMAVFTKIVDGKSVLKIALASKVLTTLASAILTLSIALKIMSTMSWSEMGVGLISLGVGLGLLVGAVHLLPETKVNSAAKAIQKMSGALFVLALAIKIMSTMSWSEMGVGLISMVVGLGALVAAVHLLPKDTALRSAGLIGLAASMLILSAALKVMGSMTWEELGISLVALAGSLAILVGAMMLMQSGVGGAAAMLIIAPALLILASALKSMTEMSWAEIARGLVTLAGSLLIIAGAMYLMVGALPGAAALIVVAGALAILAPVLTTLGSMTWSEIIKGLVAIAGAFAVIGIAGLLLGPVVPVILSLAGAIALLGVGCTLIGVGVAAIGVGLMAISAAGASAAVAITAIVASLISLIPYFIEQVGVGIIALCKVISGSADAICDAVTVIVLALIEALVTAVPPLVDGILVLITAVLEALVNHLPKIGSLLVQLFVQLLNIVTENLPTIMDAAFSLLIAVIEGLTANVGRLLSPLLDLFRTIFQGIADVIGPIIETVLGPILQVLADIFDSVFNGIATVVTSVGDSIKSVLDGIAGVIDSVGNAALNAGTGFEKLANGVKTITNLSLTDMAASLGAVAVGIGDIAAHSSGIVQIGDSLARASSAVASTATGFATISTNATNMSETLVSVNKVVLEMPTVFAAAATSVVANMVSALNEGAKQAPTAVSGMVTGVIIAINASYFQFYSAGVYLVDGFAAGITSRIWYAEAKAAAMAEAAKKAAEEALDEHSPSKEFYKVGAFAGEGFVNAFIDYESVAFGASSDMAKAATRGLNKTVSRLSDIIDGDLDIQPVIRPVVDLSSVRAGANSISGMFGIRPSVGALVAAGAISANMNSRNQNGSNDDVVSAINKLGKSLGSMGNTYNIVEGVTYDNGSEVANAIGVLAKALVREGRV